MSLEQIREIARARRKALTGLAALLLLNLCLYGYLSFWQRPALAQAQTDYFEGRAAAGGPAERRARNYRAGEKDLAQFESRLIAKREFAAFLGELFEMSQSQGLEVKGVTYRPSPLPEQGIVLYALNVTVSGKYPAVKRFIAQLSSYPRLVTVDSLSLKNPSSTEESVGLVLQVTALLKTEGA